MGIVTNSIGTAARNFSTLALWEASLPANLVTDGNSYVGECYNDSEFTGGGGGGTYLLTVSGETTDATHTITLKCHAGQSFSDNASVQSNALKYNVSNGVGVRATNAYSRLLSVAANNVTISGIQWKQINDSQAPILFTGNPVTFTGNIADATANVLVTFVAIDAESANAVVTNNLVIAGNGNNGCKIGPAAGFVFANNTIVVPSDNAGVGTGTAFVASGNYGASKCTNNAVFGFGTFADANAILSFTATGTGFNCTDLASALGSSNQVLKTYANQFVGTTTAGQDFRQHSGGTASLFDTGSTDTADIPAAIDIANTSRPQSSAWDIGAWELVAAGPPPGHPPNLPLLGVG